MPKGAGGIIYTELGNVPKNRLMTPPISNLEQSVIYTDIKAPTDPNKVSQVMIYQCCYSYHFLLTNIGSLQVDSNQQQ